MKPVKYFVKAVAIAANGAIIGNQILTPAMATEDQAFDYLNWLNSTTSGSDLKAILGRFVHDERDDVARVEFVKFETTLY